MNFKRPSFRRGGSTGIDQLTPRIKAQRGYIGDYPISFQNPTKQIGIDFPSTTMGMSIPTGNQVMAKSFPADASKMGVASVAKTRPTKKITSDFEEMVEIGGYGTIPKGPETDLNKLPSWMLSAIGTEETRKILRDRENLEEIKKQENKFLPNEGPKKVNFDEIVEEVVINPKDKKEPEEKPEETFEDIFEKEKSKLEKLIGEDEDKGLAAIALSEAIGTPGNLADKAAVLNKQLLKILGDRKKDRKDIAKLAYSATKEIQKAKIVAGKEGFSEKQFNNLRSLKKIVNDKTGSYTEAQKKAAAAEIKITEDVIKSIGGKDEKDISLTGLNQAGALIDDLSKIARRLKKLEKGSAKYIELLEEYTAKRNFALGFNNAGLNNGIRTTDAILKSGGINLKDGGRIKLAEGTPIGQGETPTAQVEQLSYAELRNRLPKEITNDVVQLLANSQEALQDFAYIRTQGDVSKFNMKYGVTLVLPAST
tara:strand:- start:22256 stop:23695 length:1440 start_codon:yes stop_codon:yes gene_type:complete